MEIQGHSTAFKVDQPSEILEQICTCVNKMDCNTADNNKKNPVRMVRHKQQKILWIHPQKIWKFLDGKSGTDGTNETKEMTENEYD